MAFIEIRTLVDVARRTTGKTDFGELVRRLVFASTARLQPSLDFLAGEANGYAGWDGWVEVQYERDGQILKHRSVWELGTNEIWQSKIRSDYKSALTKALPNGWRHGEVVYVAATLRSATPKARAALKEELIQEHGQPWAGVVFLAASDFMQWIEKLPSVEDWVSVHFQIGATRFGTPLDDWFESWAGLTKPQLRPELLTAGRDLSPLVSGFQVASATTSVQSDSTEESVGLIYCAATTLGGRDRALFLSGALVVTDETAAHRLLIQVLPSDTLPAVILVPPATNLRSRFEAAGYRVFQALGRPAASGTAIRFDRANVEDFCVPLLAMGVAEQEAQLQARASGCSPSIWHIRNLFRLDAQPQLPDWARADDVDAVAAAIFAGAWSERSERDVAVLTQLAGIDAEDLAGRLGKYAHCSAPLLEQVGSDRIVVAPTAAFEFIRPHLNRHHLSRLRRVCIEVFASIHPRVLDRWQNARPAIHVRDPSELSDALRGGLAESVLKLAALGEPLAATGALAPFETAQSYVDALLRELPGLRNDARVIASLSSQLPDLIEAAPSPFLDALEALIQGDGDGVRTLLADEAGIFGQSFHTGLLWGLERLAWLPQYVGRVTIILGKLAELDPGGQLSNRPANSLGEIFVAWNPGTSISPAERRNLLEALLRSCPSVGWRLLCELMPGKRRTSVPTQKPRWRTFAASARPIRRSDVVSAYELYISLAISEAGTDPERLADLISAYPELLPEHRRQIESALQELAANSGRGDLQRLWDKVTKLIRHHQAFPDAAWALSQSDLERLIGISNRLRSQDPVASNRWLFDEQFPDLGDRADEYEARVGKLEARRTQAIEEIFQLHGWDGVIRLLGVTRYAYTVGDAAARTSIPNEELLSGLHRIAKSLPDPRVMVLRSASRVRYDSQGEPWTKTAVQFGRSVKWSADLIAAILVDYPDESATYRQVESLTDDEQRIYWTTRFPFLRGAKEDESAFDYAVGRMVEYGRAIDVVDQNWSQLPRLGVARVLWIVEAFIKEIASGKTFNTGSLDHDLSEVFGWLRKQPEIDLNVVAQHEYAVLPLLISTGSEEPQLALHTLMQRSPEFFVQVLCDLYKPASGTYEEPAGEELEQARSRAQAAFRLLHSWRAPPGLVEGKVQREALRQWVREARELLSEKDRSSVGDQQIGRILYYLPAESERFRFCKPLRELIEELGSRELETGILMECTNARGPTWRSLDEGGAQERDLAKEWAAYAEALGSSWPRTAALCNRVVEMWLLEAEEHDKDARKTRLERSK